MVQAQPHELLNQKDSEDALSPAVVAAMHRLAKALDGLDEAASRRAVEQDRGLQQHAQLVRFERENAQLKQECANLDGAIGRLKTQYDALHQVAGTIYNKLDDSIKRLNKIME